MATCPHWKLKKLQLTPKQTASMATLDLHLVEAAFHGWYRCEDCKDLVHLIVTTEFSTDYLHRILDAAEGK